MIKFKKVKMVKCEKGTCRYGAKCIKNQVCRFFKARHDILKKIFQTKMFSASVRVLIAIHLATIPFAQESFWFGIGPIMLYVLIPVKTETS